MTEQVQQAQKRHWWRWGFESGWPIWVSIVVRAVALLLIVGFSVGGLWNKVAPPKVSGEALGPEVVRALNDNAPKAERVASADCEEIQQKKGAIADCIVTTRSGETVRVRVTMQDDEGHFIAEWF